MMKNEIAQEFCLYLPRILSFKSECLCLKFVGYVVRIFWNQCSAFTL
jgi:hypothetical protein